MIRYAGLIISLLLVLTSCASHDSLVIMRKYNRMKDPLEAVLDIRKQIEKNPDDIYYKTLIHQYELKAAEYYYKKGQKKYYEGSYQEAIEDFKKGLLADKDYDKLQQAIRFSTQQLEADEDYLEAVKNYQVGKLKEAESILKTILGAVPTYDAANSLLTKIQKEIKKNGDVLDALSDTRKISLNFRNTNIKTAFEFLSRSFNINIVFDESVKTQSLTLYAKDVTFRQALNLMLATSKMFYQRMSRNTILIAPDTKAMRDQYEEYMIRTYQLRTISAKQMSEIIKGVLKVNKMVVNDDMNTIMIRDNENILNLVSKLIDVNDRRPAEVLLDVEILEVNRNKAENLGIDYGSTISSTLPEASPTNSLNAALGSGVITLPNITFSYFKQDVDAQTLANPKIRALNKKQAKIHIGDRVPLRTATIQNPTGGTQTSYEYTEIGIQLDVDPIIHYDNSVTVDLKLEVSSLGSNVGTNDAPAYSIGTRNTQTQMLLKDGETAVIGGLIRDDDRNKTISVPGLGSIPIIGRLFKTDDDSLGRTDVLLTITPRIVRGWDIPRKSLQKIYSGTADHFSSEPIFPGDTSKLSIGDMSSNTNFSTNKKDLVQSPQLSEKTDNTALLSFDKSLYSSSLGDDFTINVSAENVAGLKKLIIPIVYNNNIIKLKDVNSISSTISDVKKKYTDNGVNLEVSFKNSGMSLNKKPILSLVMTGNNKGISYFVSKQSIATDRNGNSVPLESHASRIVVK